MDNINNDSCYSSQLYGYPEYLDCLSICSSNLIHMSIIFLSVILKVQSLIYIMLFRGKGGGGGCWFHMTFLCFVE